MMQRRIKMKSLTIRNIPDDLYKIIVNLTKSNHRSIQQQILFILERCALSKCHHQTISMTYTDNDCIENHGKILKNTLITVHCVGR